jgi:aminopeptidase YwaD
MLEFNYKTYFRYALILPYLAISLICFAQKTDNNLWLEHISKESLMQTTGYLSSSRFMGRLPGSAEYEMAARYVASRFKESGLKPLYSDSFLQFFDVEHNQILKANAYLVNNDGLKQELILGKDFVCRGFTGSGNIIGNLVFAGFGISTSNYDDYANIDVNGKIVMVYKGTPNWKNPMGKWEKISPRDKARVAEENGAIGIVFIQTPNENPKLELIGSIACGEGMHLNNFPMIQVSSRIASRLISIEGKTPEATFHKITTNQLPYSFEIDAKIQIDIEAKYTPNKRTPNVVGVWEGYHPKKKKEFVVVGAHLDHVGSQQGLIFPGANDNASGVAALVEMANALKKGNIRTKRSILFVVFSAEESGMQGSKHFVQNSAVDARKMLAMLNFDCVADGDSIAIGGRHSFPKLWAIAQCNDAMLTNNLCNKTFGGGGADAEAFYQKGIPTLYFHTSGGYKHLHLSTDTAETLNEDLFEKLTVVGFATLIDIANGKYKSEKDALKKYRKPR